MENNSTQTQEATQTSVISPEQLLAHWQGHRKLTRRVIETFPEDALFSYAVGGMRPFSELALEMIGMGGAGVIGMATGNWGNFTTPATSTKAELLPEVPVQFILSAYIKYVLLFVNRQDTDAWYFICTT